MLEKEIRKKIIKRYRSPTCMINAIETPSTGGKVGDLFIRSPTNSWWVELKHLNKITERIPWRPGQVEWAQHYMQLGGDYALIISFGEILYVHQNPVVLPLQYSNAKGRTVFNVIHASCTIHDTIHGLPDNLWITE